jgi:hypothetical protein
MLGAILLLIILTVPSLKADDSLLVNYQGHLADNAGNALTGNYTITFRIYESQTGSTALWSETHLAVPVARGLFQVSLGTSTTLPGTIFSDGDRYLGISIAGGLELSPRSLLGTSPKAAVAGAVSSRNIETRDGSLLLKHVNGDSSLVLSRFQFGSSIRLFDPDPDPTGLGQFSVLDIKTDTLNGATITLFDPDPDPPGDAIEISSGRISGPSIKMFDPQPEPPGHQRLEISSSSDLGACIRMFDPQPEPPGKMFELLSGTTTAPSMTFFDHGSEVMGVEPSPFNTGYAIKMFDPQPEPPGKLFEILTTYSSQRALPDQMPAGASTEIALYTPAVGGVEQKVASLLGDDTGAELRLGFGANTGSSNSYAYLLSDASHSSFELIGAATVAPAPPIFMSSTGGTARVGIGTLTPTQSLHVEGNIYYTGSLMTPSDAAFKTDIEPIENALDAVNQIDGVTYYWKQDQYPDKQFDDHRQIGLIAQQVKEVLPEAVSMQEDGYYAIDYSRLTPLLLEAIKQLKSENDDLKARIEALEKKDK